MEIIQKYFSDFSAKQLEQLTLLGDVYTEWNSKINVISRKDIGGLYEKHVLHSLAIAAAFDFPPGSTVIDIGTGGGFPGIPLAIYFPEVNFLLVDSINKKLKVVEAVREATGLKNVSTKHGRAEEIRDRKFDFAVSRAVAPLKDLWRWSKPLLNGKSFAIKEPGVSESLLRSGLVCLKGGDLAQEVSESGLRPKMIEISNLFAEEYFKEKFLVYVPKQG
jgi:16S rRNA (guanine527-N7)-methyltransferase